MAGSRFRYQGKGDKARKIVHMVQKGEREARRAKKEMVEFHFFERFPKIGVGPRGLRLCRPLIRATRVRRREGRKA
jgi:hypothetical protein